MQVYEKLAITDKLALKQSLEKEVAEPDIWKDVATATAKNQELSRLSDEVQPWELLKAQINDMGELIKMADDDLKDEMGEQISAMETELRKLRKALRFQGPYDANDAIVRITSGAGGTEAMDWASMLERMYLRFFEKKGFREE